MIFSFFTSLNHILSSNQFILISMIVSFLVKTYLLFKLIRYSEKTTFLSFFLALTLTSSAVEDLSWIARIGEDLFFPGLDYRIRIFIIRFAWGFSVLNLQSL